MRGRERVVGVHVVHCSEPVSVAGRNENVYKQIAEHGETVQGCSTGDVLQGLGSRRHVR